MINTIIFATGLFTTFQAFACTANVALYEMKNSKESSGQFIWRHVYIFTSIVIWTYFFHVLTINHG